MRYLDLRMHEAGTREAVESFMRDRLLERGASGTYGRPRGGMFV
jgi:hypothetical protein